MCTPDIICVTWPQEIRSAIEHRSAGDPVYLRLRFQMNEETVEHDMKLLSIRPQPCGCDHALIMFGNGRTFTLAIPPEGHDTGVVDIIDPRRAAAVLHTDPRTLPQEVSGLEEYLRWQSAVITETMPEPCDGVYGNNPRLHHLPRAVREQIAARLAAGKTIPAIVLIRKHGIGLADAATIVTALQTWT